MELSFFCTELGIKDILPPEGGQAEGTAGEGAVGSEEVL